MRKKNNTCKNCGKHFESKCQYEFCSPECKNEYTKTLAITHPKGTELGNA